MDLCGDIDSCLTITCICFQLPQISLFAIGMHKNASKPSLNVIAGTPLRVLSYKAFVNFKKDQSQVRLRPFCHSTRLFSINHMCNFGQ